MIRKFIFLFCFIFFILATPIVAESGENNSETINTSFGPVQGISIYKTGIIKTSGEMPTQEISAEYWPKLDRMTDVIHDENLLASYSFIMGYGPSTKGYFSIGTCYNCEIKEEELDEIMDIVKKVGQGEGIEDVPIVIARVGPGTNATPPETIHDDSIPGFTLPMCLLAIAALIGINYKPKQKK
ncbi:hypothetical protein [Methanolapillus millepedarum]|uniref:Uncharacterized protein n=1 Tax=Methanolapillus millepedarum TaxID=3028296 RepID=A0AA96ZWK6_9EURY|nr:hypothetical protein MsAc7_16640 [Methanosarcinaceae archaeon Ac7]